MLFLSGDNTIYLTRGDSASIQLTLKDASGEDYVPVSGDQIRFAVKKHYTDREPLLDIRIPTDSLVLTILPEDTENLEFGEYKYDIQITYSTGEIDTFIDRSIFCITEEVD